MVGHRREFSQMDRPGALSYDKGVPSSFPGFPKAGIDFFRALARNNNRDWFLPRKPVFEEQVKKPMAELVAAVNAALSRFAPEYVTEPERAIYRFYRDTRFSNDKTPYKDHIAATFSRHSMDRHQGAGFYFAVSNTEIAVGGGLYLAPPESLAAVRRRIEERHGELRRLMGSRTVKRLLGDPQGERLSRVPKGYAPDHPAADLLRFKQLYFYANLPPEIAVTPDIRKEIVSRFKAMTPFIEFINGAILAERRKSPPKNVFV